MKRKMTAILLTLGIAGHASATTPPLGHLFSTGQRKVISDGRNHEQGPGAAFMGVTIAP